MRDLVAAARTIGPARFWMTVFVLAALAYAATVWLYSHQVGLNGIFRGDARLYAYRTYRILGYSRHDAVETMRPFFVSRGIPVGPHDFGGLAGQIARPRVVYPLLSAPFVALFGAGGMAVVPALCYLLSAFGMAYLFGRMFSARVALVVVAGWLTSYVVGLWTVAALTESVTITLMIGILLCLPLHRSASRRDLVVFGLLAVVLAFTRQATPMIAGAVTLAWLWTAVRQRRLRTEWLAFAATGLLVSIATSAITVVFAPFDFKTEMLVASHQPTFAAALHHLPTTMGYFLQWDLRVLSNDKVMCLVVLLAIVQVVRFFGSLPSALLLGGFIPYFLLNVLNGTPSGTRYAAPIFPLFFLAATTLALRWLNLPEASPEHPEPVGEVVQHSVARGRDRLGEEVVHAEGDHPGDDPQREHVVDSDEHEVSRQMGGEQAIRGEDDRAVESKVDAQPGAERRGRGQQKRGAENAV